MKLATWQQNEKETAGLVVQGLAAVRSFADCGLPYETMLDFLARHTEADLAALRAQENESGTSLSDVRLLAPIPRPHHDIICLGLNYAPHAEESIKFLKTGNDTVPEEAIYFSKRVITATGPGAPIEAHTDITNQLDYEAELAVIIGKTGRNIPKEDAWRHVFGVCCFNDVSARELQRGHKQWYFGKSLDGFTAMGPWIVTLDEFALPLALDIASRVNGEERQHSNTRHLIHGIPKVIAELSQGITLDAGTVIATGTCAGVGGGFDPPRFMQPGDVCEIEIEGCGVLRNTIAK